MKTNKNQGSHNYKTLRKISQERKSYFIISVVKDYLHGNNPRRIAANLGISRRRVKEALDIGMKAYQPSRGKGQRLSFADRRFIEWALSRGWSNYRIAEQLRCSCSTIANELSRREERYNAKLAQKDYNDKNKGERTPYKLEAAEEFINYYEKQAEERKESPYSVRQRVSAGNCPEELKDTPVLSVSTLYSYIKRDLIKIKPSDLPLMLKRKPSYIPPKKEAKRPKGQSIELRPEIPKDEFGHWELDCVEGPKEKGAQALLVLTEKKTRFTLLLRLKSHTAMEVNRKLISLCKKVRLQADLIFKTITTDNGKEFSSVAKLSGFYERTYFCHVGDPTEKPQVENYNGLLRRFIPKGSRISDYSDEDLQFFQDSLNDLHRRSLDGRTAESLFQEELEGLDLSLSA